MQAKIQSGKLYKVITFPNKFPSDILKKKKLKIGFDPKLYTQKTLKIFFKKTNCKLISINKNLNNKLWVKKVNNNLKKFYFLSQKEKIKN